MMYEADLSNKGYISKLFNLDESDFMYIIAKQKVDYRQKLETEASRFFNLEDVFVALGGKSNLEGTITYQNIKDSLKGDIEFSADVERMLKKICHNKEEVTFEEFIKFFQ